MAYSQGNWRKKGLGWIPDLPDVSDPTIPTVVGDAIHVQSAADSSAVEETINLLINVLKQKQNIESDDIQNIKIKLLGDTRFPRVKVYTILRKSSVAHSQKNTRLAKEIVQLRLALYLIYQKFSRQKPSATVNISNVFTGPITNDTADRSKQSHNYQPDASDILSSNPQADQPGDITRQEQKDQEHRQELRTIFEPQNALKLMGWLQNPCFDDSLEVMVIDFQRLAGLIGDGIVGPKTIAAIQAYLTNSDAAIDDSPQVPEVAHFLCPLTLIPRDVLKEVFQQLTHQWLYEQIKSKVDSTLSYILSTVDFDSSAIEEINRSWHELDGFIREELHAITAIPRDHLTPYPEKASERLQDNLDKRFAEAFHAAIRGFCQRLSSRCRQLVGRHNFKLNDENRQEVDRLLMFEVLHSEETCHRFAVKSGLDDPVDNALDVQELYRTDFIFYKYDVFVDEFKRWFREVEPFIAALMQMLSPLGSFDNFKRAVEVSFERLEGCFQLHQLTDRSIASPYRNLIAHYSPPQLIEQIEELKVSRETIIHLFKEVASKINRILQDSLFFRRILLANGEFLELDLTQPSNEAILYQKIEEIVQQKSYISITNFESQWKNFIWPIANNIYEDIHKKVESIETSEARKTAIQQELERQIEDVEVYISFFKFFESIIQGFLSRYDMISSQALSEATVADKDLLSSSLTEKEKIFEIVPDDLLETFTSSDRTLATDFRSANRDLATDQETAIATQLLDPIQLKLPVNFNLLDIASRQQDHKTRYYFFLPGVVDLSYWCSPVEDQGAVNACTAFAGIALVEYFAQKRYGKYSNLSARFLYKTARNLMSHLDDEGASVRKTMEALVLFGVPPEDAWPWDEQEFNAEPPAFCYAYAQSYQALKYFRLDTPEIPTKELLLFQIKAVLAAGLPCMFGFTIYSSFFKEKSIRLGHVTFPGVRDQIVGGHAAVAVGYNDYMVIERLDGQPAKPGAILIRNSWGTEWGKGGYGWLPYEYVLEGLTADWWSLLKSEWLDGGAFGIGAVDPGNRDQPTDSSRGNN